MPSALDPTSADAPVIHTFSPRRRALSARRARILEEHGEAWSLDPEGPPLDLAAVFGRTAPVVLEIGIGLGEAAVEMATADPGTDVIGIDVHTPGIAAAIDAIVERGLRNLRLVHGDALRFVRRLPAGSLQGIRIFFPDPWPKARHRRKRLVTEANLERLVPLLGAGGWLHVATDISDYAQQVTRVCGAHPQLEGGRIDRPAERPVTRYERKARAAGRPVADLRFVRRA